MQYRRLGNSGLMVSEIGLGGNTFGWWIDEDATSTIINRAIDIGVNYIDTADMYDRGRSEEFIGKAIQGKRHQVIIATKFGYPMGDNPNERGGSRYYIMKAVDASLKRLQTDYIDLYQMHIPDSSTPIEETLCALNHLLRSGKVIYIGCSNFPAWQLCEALWTSRVNNLPSFITIQSYYNLIARDIERELVPCCQTYNIGVIPWGPLAAGFLTGKYQRGKKMPANVRLTKPPPIYNNILTDTNFDKLAKLEAFAKEHGHRVGELAIAWLLAKPWISTVITGVRQLEQLTANVAAAEWKLTPNEVAEVDAIS